MKVMVAMSGGVDSSVAAVLTKEMGYECIGATIKLYHDEDIGIPKSKTCCTMTDTHDARSVAFKLNIPFYVFNFTKDFSEKVIDKFVFEYENSRTPNPCIDCNRYMKFDRLFDRANILHCDKIATGHYARVSYNESTGLWELRKSLNTKKDQSYVLYFLNQNTLPKVLFPLGEFYDKSQVREIAQKYGFVTADKEESQDICFVPDGNYAKFITFKTGKKSIKGNFVDTNGKVLGEHNGIINYTVGQRRGLGLSLPQPMYVVEKNLATNTVVLGTAEELYFSSIVVEDFSWVSGILPQEPIHGLVKIRYSSLEIPATITQTENTEVIITFDTPCKAATVGQAAVVYDGDLLLGGGTIKQAIRVK